MSHHRQARRTFLRNVGAAALLAELPARHAISAELTQVPGEEPYPSHAIKLVVPLAAGGGADIVARLVAERLSQRLGQVVVVDNRAGGGTVIGAAFVAKAPPDGYTLLWGTATTHAINASLVKNLPYDPVKDFVPIALVAVLPLILVVNPAVLPVNSLQELVAYARRNPGKLNFGSAGNGSAFHLAGEMLNQVAHIQTVHVPYKGAAPALADLLGGQVQFIFTTIPPVLPYLQDGKLRAIAVANSRRSSLLPDLPTTAEAGAPGVDASAWNGYMAPARTPPEITDRIARELKIVMAERELSEKLKAQGVEPMYMGPSEFAVYMVTETQRYAAAVQSSHAHLD